MRELHLATEALLDAVAHRYGINRTDLRCLEVLEREGPMTAGRLAAASHLSPAAVTKVVDRLDRAGYLIRRASPADRRAQIVAVSGVHAELRTAVWGPVVDEATTAMGPRTPDELRRLVEDLRRLGKLSRRHADRLASG